MDIRKSINVAVAQKGITKTDLADNLGVSRQRVYSLARQKSVRHETIERLATALDMKVSEFIALGE